MPGDWSGRPPGCYGQRTTQPRLCGARVARGGHGHCPEADVGKRKTMDSNMRAGLTAPSNGRQGPDAPLPDLGVLKPTPVYNTYWRFAAERQAVFFRRLEGQ